MYNYAKDVFGVANVLNLQPLKLRVEVTLIGVFGVLEFVVFACENIFDVPFEDCDTFQGNCNVNIDIETIVSYLIEKKGTVRYSLIEEGGECLTQTALYKCIPYSFNSCM